MNKKYLKYIFLIFVLMFSFNVRVVAKQEKIDMELTEVKTNLCEYTFEGMSIKIYSTTHGTLDKFEIVAPEIIENNYGGYNSDFLDARLFNQRTCPNIKVFQLNEVLYFSTSEDFSNISEMIYKTTISGSVKRIITVCSYKAENAKLDIIFNPVNKKINYPVYGVYSLKKSVRKNWKYNENGLVCREDIVADVCTEGVTFRSTTDKTAKNCYKSTNPVGYIEVNQNDEDYNEEIKYLADICEENSTVVTIIRVVGYVLVIAKILVPILLIIFGIISFSKVVISGKDDDTKKAATGLLIKFIAAIVIFVLPTIINFIFETIEGATDGTEDYENCRICIFDPKNCKIPK